MSIVIEAKPKPTVYGCSYLSTGNDTLDQSICHTKNSKGDLSPLKALNASDGELRYSIPITSWTSYPVNFEIITREEFWEFSTREQ